MADNEEYLTLTQARKILGVSRPKIGRMVEKGELVVTTDPRDARVKLVRRSDVEALAKQPQRSRQSDQLALAL